MKIDQLFPIKPQMAAILDLFFSETLKVTNSFRNEFSIKNHVKMRFYIKLYVKSFINYNFTMAFDGHFKFCKKRMFRFWTFYR